MLAGDWDPTQYPSISRWNLILGNVSVSVNQKPKKLLTPSPKKAYSIMYSPYLFPCVASSTAMRKPEAIAWCWTRSSLNLGVRRRDSLLCDTNSTSIEPSPRCQDVVECGRYFQNETLQRDCIGWQTRRNTKVKGSGTPPVYLLLAHGSTKVSKPIHRWIMEAQSRAASRVESRC